MRKTNLKMVMFKAKSDVIIPPIFNSIEEFFADNSDNFMFTDMDKILSRYVITRESRLYSHLSHSLKPTRHPLDIDKHTLA